MEVTSKKLAKGEVELKVELPVEELKPYLEQAAKNISSKQKIAGFRPGMAPYDVVLKQFGAMAIYNEAAYLAVEKSLFQAIAQQKLVVVGQPKVDLEKIAPDNPLVFRAIVPVMPKVVIGDYSGVKISKQPAEVRAEEVDKVINQLQRMRAKAVVVDRPAHKGDKVEIDCMVASKESSAPPEDLQIEPDGMVGAALSLGGKITKKESIKSEDEES